MGRSVSYPRGAVVAFTVMEVEEGHDWDFEFEWLRDDLRERAAEAFPSLASHDGWRGREDRILMRNAFADFGVSVYGELVAVWIAERDDGGYWDAEWRTARSPRAQHWLEQIAKRFDRVFGDYGCLGRFSNGEAIYRKRADSKAGRSVAIFGGSSSCRGLTTSWPEPCERGPGPAGSFRNPLQQAVLARPFGPGPARTTLPKRGSP